MRKLTILAVVLAALALVACENKAEGEGVTIETGKDGAATIEVGGVKVEAKGGEEGGSVVVKTGDKTIEAKGGEEGGTVKADGVKVDGNSVETGNVKIDGKTVEAGGVKVNIGQ